MWDVKGFAMGGLTEGSMFYLNYVGCKVVLSSSGPSQKYCFTLTMWDVKDNGFIDEAIPPEFYLNYVGCKAA